MAGRADTGARHGKSALFQTVENGPVNIRHDSWRADASAGTSRHDPGRLGKMRLSPRERRRTCPPQRRIGENRARFLNS